MSTNKKKKRIVLGVVGSICIIAIGVAVYLSGLGGLLQTTKRVETCATYNGDMPQLEDTSPKCREVSVEIISESRCEQLGGTPVYDKTPGDGPWAVYEKYPDSKYLGCSREGEN